MIKNVSIKFFDYHRKIMKQNHPIYPIKMSFEHINHFGDFLINLTNFDYFRLYRG